MTRTEALLVLWVLINILVPTCAPSAEVRASKAFRAQSRP